MTDATLTEGEGDFIELPPGDPAFAALMDILAPHEYEEEEGAGGDSTPVAGEGTPAPAAPVPGAGEAGAEPAAPADGAEPVPAPAGDPAAVDASTLDSNWGAVLTALEERHVEDMTLETVEEIRAEYGKYIEATEKPATLLVGQELPNHKGEGIFRPRDSVEAQEWIDSIKYTLGQEAKDRISRKSDDTRPMMNTLTRSIELFRANHDLIPNTRQFDKELADRFTELAEPYKLDVDGKFVGYTIDVAPMVKQVRAQLLRERAAEPAAPVAAPAAQPTAQQQRVAEQPRATNGSWVNPDAPQAAIPSKAGASDDGGEDLSTLWGTLGLPASFRV